MLYKVQINIGPTIEYILSLLCAHANNMLRNIMTVGSKQLPTSCFVFTNQNQHLTSDASIEKIICMGT